MLGGLTSMFRKAATGLTQNLKTLSSNLKGIGNSVVGTIGEFAGPVLALATIGAVASTFKQPQPA